MYCIFFSYFSWQILEFTFVSRLFIGRIGRTAFREPFSPLSSLIILITFCVCMYACMHICVYVWCMYACMCLCVCLSVLCAMCLWGCQRTTFWSCLISLLVLLSGLKGHTQGTRFSHPLPTKPSHLPPRSYPGMLLVMNHNGCCMKGKISSPHTFIDLIL